MQERIDRFASAIHEKGHLRQLVRKLDLCLKIETESETFYLSFKEGRVESGEDWWQTGLQATLCGKDELMDQLFDGKLKLRYGVKWKHFQTDCPFRTQLVLESLFYLARPLPL